MIKKICDLVGNGCFLVFVLTNFSFPFFSHIKNRSLDQFPPMSNTPSEDGSRPSPRRLWTVLLLTSSGSEEVLALPTEVSELPNTSLMPKITLTDLKFDVIFSKLRKCESNQIQMVFTSIQDAGGHQNLSSLSDTKYIHTLCNGQICVLRGQT